jgi:hypothetical protein
MPLSFGLGYQDLPNLTDRIRTMRDVLRYHSLRQDTLLAEEGIVEDGHGQVILCLHAEETIRQMHRELALRDLGLGKDTKGAVDVFEKLPTWRYVETEHSEKSISIRTVVNDLDVVLRLLNIDASDYKIEKSVTIAQPRATEKIARLERIENMLEALLIHSQGSKLPKEVPAERAERRRLLNEYKAKCKAAGRKITYDDIGLAVKPGSQRPRTIVDKWRAGHPDYEGYTEKFLRMFREKPHLKDSPVRSPQKKGA